ncbi:MAG TPA: alpha/beta fold hydrolase [Trueperaceae bacterium]|nr:alpha/beta fold hydrolase [Trueperaceae bacterium]
MSTSWPWILPLASRCQTAPPRLHGSRTGAGAPVLYCHGTPASKHNWYLNHDPALLAALGLRVYALDRPGLGGSDFQANRTLADWVADVENFADSLGLERFALLGYSCGSPYALACALHLEERVTGTTLVSGMVDYTWPELASYLLPQSFEVLKLATANPRASRLIYRLMRLSARYAPAMMIRQAHATMPVADREVLPEPAVRGAFVAMLNETVAQGPTP